MSHIYDNWVVARMVVPCQDSYSKRRDAASRSSMSLGRIGGSVIIPALEEAMVL
jgi:hypothetical protein